MTIALLGILLLALLLLMILTIVDIRIRLLPNIYVFPFAALGPLFHALADFEILSPGDILIGGLLGYGLLWSVRYAANAYYKQDALGLGDVKLMGAAGLWLGPEGLLFALTLGAFAGTLHGCILGLWIALQEKRRPDFRRLMLPAGPGFIVGIIAVGVWLIVPYMKEWLHGFGA